MCARVTLVGESHPVSHERRAGELHRQDGRHGAQNTRLDWNKHCYFKNVCVAACSGLSGWRKTQKTFSGRQKKVVSARSSLFLKLGYCWSSLLGDFASLLSLGYFLKPLTFNFVVAVFFF